ncbi:hypothetical protein Ac2012v2_003977 [Leucoagaricus gongylophorus]
MDPFALDRGVDAKIVVMGSAGVGKSSLLCRYIQNQFDPNNTTSTSGALFVTKKVMVNGLKVRLQLWDTAGQERFRSMAPMYYRGANAALLLYDITNISTFDDVRSWLLELKKNCSPDLLIYIVGAKADLHHHRSVTPDIVRLSLHNWFPDPTPPPPPPPQTSTLSYIRPRFTSFPGLRSHSAPSSSLASSHTPPYLQRSKTTVQVRPRTNSSFTRSNTSSGSRTPQSSRFGSHFGFNSGWDAYGDNSSNSIEEQDEYALESQEFEWGLSKGMELFEVSAKDDIGIQSLFDHLMSAIILRKDAIERENELRKRDSIVLSNVSAPTWSAQADEEEARQKAQQRSTSCC